MSEDVVSSMHPPYAQNGGSAARIWEAIMLL